MKIRNGFVSNSSSSSFIIMTTVENYEKVMQGFSQYHRDVMDAVGGEQGEFLGKDIISFSTYDDNGYGTWDYVQLEPPETPLGKQDICASDAFDQIVAAIRKSGICFDHHESR